VAGVGGRHGLTLRLEKQTLRACGAAKEILRPCGAQDDRPAPSTKGKKEVNPTLFTVALLILPLLP